MSEPGQNGEGKPSTLIVVVTVIATVIGAAIGSAAVSSLPPETMARIVGGVLAGAACGLIPFFVGRKRDKQFALIALGACALAGAALGVILALPLALILTFVISRRAPQEARGDS
jgi:hypothetical protein